MSRTTIVTEQPPATQEAPRFPTCPVCEQPSVEVWTLYTHVSCECRVCGWQARLTDAPQHRDGWHSLIGQAARRLRMVYALPLPVVMLQPLLDRPDPVGAWDTMEFYLREAADATAPRSPAIPITEWLDRRDTAIATEAVWIRHAVWGLVTALWVADGQVS